MKKLVCYILVLLFLLSSLTACSFVEKVFEIVEDEAEANPKVEKMLTALVEKRTDDAKSLMHPQASENMDDAIMQMSDYLAGREVSSMEMSSINVNVSSGTSGKTRKEELTYQVTLTDGTNLNVDVVYLSNNDGEGFVTFQLALGVE